jgi:hypothetical protein
VLRRRAAAAADHVHEARRGELAEDRPPSASGVLVVLAEGVRQAGVRIGADVGVRPGEFLDVRPQLLAAERAVQPDRRAARAWRTEFQKASVVWPDSVRPEASVIVPEIMTGTSSPSSSSTLRTAYSAAFAFSVSKIVSTSSRSDAAVEQRARRVRVGRRELVEGDVARAGIVDVRRERRRAAGGPERAGDEARPAGRASTSSATRRASRAASQFSS